MIVELEGASHVGVASLIGLAVGLEREWSGHASGPAARFAGLRTFLLLGALGGVAGLLIGRGAVLPAAFLLAGGATIATAAYVAAVRRPAPDLDGTTEVAALVVLSLATLAGFGWLLLSSAAGALVVLALNEKQRLHAVVRAIGEAELQAGLQFTVLAVVVLPLLPEGPYLGPLAVRPRALWSIVLAFCALNFASYVARRVVGAARGYGIAGALGGLLSSTAVTLTYARRSRADDGESGALALGVVAACTILVPRILVIGTALNPGVALAALPYLAPVFAVGVVVVWLARRRAAAAPESAGEETDDRSPLRILTALQMAVAFQVALSGVAILAPKLGEIGVYGLAVALGLTDMDALTVSMSSPSSRIAPAIAGRAVAIGVLTNTLFKLALALVIGTPGFRRRAGLGLAALAAAAFVALWLL